MVKSRGMSQTLMLSEGKEIFNSVFGRKKIAVERDR